MKDAPPCLKSSLQPAILPTICMGKQCDLANSSCLVTPLISRDLSSQLRPRAMSRELARIATGFAVFPMAWRKSSLCPGACLGFDWQLCRGMDAKSDEIGDKVLDFSTRQSDPTSYYEI